MPQMGLVKSAKAEIQVGASVDVAQILEGSLLPEVRTPTSERSRVEVEAKGDGLVIRVEASDTAALRAALNSYLRWVAAILDVVENVGKYYVK